MRGLLVLVFSALAGCLGLTVTRINSAEERPNNVWVFFTVKGGEGSSSFDASGP